MPQTNTSLADAVLLKAVREVCCRIKSMVEEENEGQPER